MQAPINKPLSGVQKVGVKLIQGIELLEEIARLPKKAYHKTNVFFGLDGEEANDDRLFFYGCMTAMTLPAIYIVAAL